MNKLEQNIGILISFLSALFVSIYISFGYIDLANPNQLTLVFVAILLSISLLFIFVIREFRKEKNSIAINYFNIGIQRYVLAIVMILYGIPKLFGNFFDYQLYAIDKSMLNTSDFQLAWFFYGKKNWFELFSGVMEFVPALFLFHKRTYFVASLILLPVTSQIFILNFFYKIGGITLPAAIILLSANLYIIYSQKEKIKLFLTSLNLDFSNTLNYKWSGVIKFCKLIGFTLFIILILFKVKPLLFKSTYQKAYQNLVGVYTLQEMKRNNINYIPSNDSIYYKDIYIEKQARWNMLRKFNNEPQPFILNINTEKSSLELSLNNGGEGDDPDIIDTLTTLKGTYKLENGYLIINGIQIKDTLELKYKKVKTIEPKKWFW